MTIDLLLSQTRALAPHPRIARLEAELRHYYYKSIRKEYPLCIGLRDGKPSVVLNRIGAQLQ